MKILQTKGSFYRSMILLCCATAFVACHDQSSDSNNLTSDDIMCLCPPTIYLQPYGNFTQKEASKLGKELESHLFEIFNVDLFVNFLLIILVYNLNKKNYKII